MVDVVSRYWLSTVLFPEETSVQVENAFIDALQADGKGSLLEDLALVEQLASGEIPDNDERVPMLLAVSDNGPHDEHHGRGEAIRKARRDGLTAARTTRRTMRQDQPEPASPDEDN